MSEIKGHKDKYQNDFNLIVQDLGKLDVSKEQTIDIKKVSEVFSNSYEKRIVNKIEKANNGFQISLKEGLEKVAQVLGNVHEFDKVIQTKKIEKIETLSNVATELQGHLAENTNEKKILSIVENNEFSKLIVKADEIEEETDSVYTKHKPDEIEEESDSVYTKHN
jgi:hypothetical protein